MGEKPWRVVIVDMPHREELFAEIWIHNEQWAEVFLENNVPMIETYAHPTNGTWSFEYTDLQAIMLEIATFLESMTDIKD